MRKGEVEKSLKRFFKRKVSYSFSLLISFLISGGIVFGEEISVESLQQSKTEILGKIQTEREEIKRKLAENQKLLKKLSVDSRLLLKEADFYAKPLETAYASSILADYKRVHSVGKDWKGSIRSNTHMDNIRERYNKTLSSGTKGDQGTLLGAAQYTHNSHLNGHRSSGWINFGDEYNKNTNIYDYESRFFVLPIVKSPVIEEAEVLNVLFTVPSAPVVIPVTSPSMASVSIGTVTIVPPTVALPSIILPIMPVQPGDITVSVNEPDINIAIGAINVVGPGTLNIPGLVTPSIAITLNPLVPPSIVPPSPSVSSPSAPNAPTFDAYVASGGTWLGYKGVNYFDTSIIYAPSGVAAVSTWAQTEAYLSSGKIRRQTDTNAPLINGANIEAGDTNAGTSSTGDGRGKVYAYRDSTGGHSGYKNIKSSENFAATDIKYSNGTQVMNGAGTYVSSPAKTAGTIFEDEIDQKNRWVVTNTGRGLTPLVLKDIDFKIGGADGTPGTPIEIVGDAKKIAESGVVLLRNNGVTVFDNCSIELMGLTTLSSELQHYSASYATGIEFRNTDISITGDKNTLFSGQAYPEFEVSGTLDKRTANVKWALPQVDNVQGKSGIYGVLNMSIETSKNAYFYMKPWTSTRWSGYNAASTQMSDGTYKPFSSVANPEGLLVYYPTPGRFRVENSDGVKKGILSFNGSGNVGLWLNHYVADRTQYSYNSAMSPDEAPFVDLGTVYMNADENVGIYLAKSEKRPDNNGIFQGNLVLDYKVGVNLYSKLESDGSISTGNTQLGSGNTDGDDKKSSGNVALYVESGQRKELTIANGYFPATTDLETKTTNSYGGVPSGTQIGYTELVNDPIKDLMISEYKVEFGEYSKNNIAVVAKNGSVVVINPSSKITDGQETESNDNKRAEGTVIAYAEGVWFNPRPAVIKPNDGTIITSGAVTDGTAGQKYVLGYGSEINLMQDLEMGGKKSYAAITNKGGKANTKNITIHGAGSTGVYADGTYKWDNGSNAVAVGVAGAATEAKSIIRVDGDIILDHADGENTGAAAVSYDGVNTGDGAEVTVTGNLKVNGLGAYANGSTSKVEILGNNSVINTGSNGALIAFNRGRVNFYGGSINHDTAGQLAFYSSAAAGNRGNLVFIGATTVNMSKGVVFYGDSSDFAGSTGGTTSYNGMSNVTINLTDNGVNLGVFKGVTTVWDGGSDYLNHSTNGLKNIPQVAAIVDNGYWYDSSLEGGNLSITTNVNRDYTSTTPGPGNVVDGFNNITMEKEKVVLENGYTVLSIEGNGLYLGSNNTAALNTESGYVIKGKVDISRGTGEAIAVYTSFGHIEIETGGEITVGKGVAAYGVNGSKIENKTGGEIKVTSSDSVNSGIGILSLATNESGTPDAYGKNNGEVGAWGEVINKGDITVGGTHGIGIYVENNDVTAAKVDIKITNEGRINLGDEGKGIVVKNSNGAVNGGTITLKDSTGTPGNKDISVGKKGIGVYTQNSDITMDGDYGISIKEGGVALQTDGNTNITTTSVTDKLTVEYNGAAGTGTTAMGMAFKGNTSADIFTNQLNLEVINTGNAETAAGIYGTGTGKIINNADITLKSTGTYGILSNKVEVVNTGSILVGDSGAAVSGAVGIYAADASITTDGDKVTMLGNGDTSSNTHPIGIYAQSSTALAVNETVDINQGSGTMNVSGKNGIGIYIEDNAGGKIILDNDSDITLSNSATENDKKFAMFLSNAWNTANDTNAVITVGANNIGIYSKNSILTNSGTINVTHTAVGTRGIGVHNVTDNGNFEFQNNGIINVTGAANIGISAATAGTNTGTIKLGNGTINVTTASFTGGDIPIGVYAKGNNIIISSAAGNITAGANTIGTYLEGNTSSSTNGNITFNISSNANGKIGIGAYYKEGTFADTGIITVNSTSTALDISGDPIRPIGVFYGENSVKNIADMVLALGSDEAIGMYGTNLTSFNNSGDITLNAKGIGEYFVNSNVTSTGDIDINVTGGYGAYFKGGVSSSSGTVTAAGNNSVGMIVTGTGGKVTNTGTLLAQGISSIGVYAENGGEFINLGILNSTAVGSSIGGFAKQGTLTNTNTGNITSEYMGLYGKDASTINHSGTMTINSGIGILVDGNNSTANLNGGTIIDIGANMTAVVGKNTGKVNLNGTNITMSNNSVGMILDGGSSVLTSGNITVGNNGTGIYAENSSIDVQGYSGTISMGSKGIAIYADDSNLTSGSFKTVYSNGAGDKGVGIYYKGSSPIINTAEVVHTGNHLVSIYADGVSISNSGNQAIQDDGIGIYANNGSSLSNTGTLNISGKDTVGIYIDGASVVTGLGTINGTPVSTGNKIGAYVKNGDITGNSTYNFGVNKGVGIYLSNNTISYTGTLNLTGEDRAIGIYAEPSVTGNIGADINVSGKDSIGLYLGSSGMAGANITYTGDLNISAVSTSARGIGAYIDTGATFTLGAGGTVNIGGTDNIGFYVNNGATLNLIGGTVTNTVDGIFAYIDDGILTFNTGSTLNINYTNVIVSGSLGTITNNTAINVGSSGLQGDNGATITNSGTGTISGTALNGKAMVGTGLGTTLTNSGNINLTGDKSIGMYAENQAVGTSTGNISVGDKSAAYYAGANGMLNISGTASVGEDSTLLYAAGGDINYTGSDIIIGNKSIALTLSGASLVDFNGKNITVGNEGTGVFITDTGDFSGVSNLGDITVGNKGTGVYIDNAAAFASGNDINLTGAESVGIFTTKNGNINYSGNMLSAALKTKGIINTGAGTTVNTGNIKLTGDASIGIYGENGTSVTNTAGAVIEVGKGAYTGTVLDSAVGIYGKNAGSILNDGTVKIDKDAVGIYGENTFITNTGSIQNAGGKNTGIYGIGQSVVNTGSITLGDTSNGIFVKNGSIVTNTGNISVGDNHSAGIYGTGSTGVQHNGGTITVGTSSTGIATENGNINVAAGAGINAGIESSYIYSASGNGTSDTNLTLSDYSIGMYTKVGSMTNTGTITAGKSTVGAGVVKVSVGMAAETGNLVNAGTINVPFDHGVGMVANDGGTALNTGTINVGGSFAYGMQATKNSTLINNGTINVDGNNSRGMAATNSSTVINNGNIQVNGSGNEGIYVDYGATVRNNGTIHISNVTGTGIYIGDAGVVLNEGTITVAVVGTSKVIQGGGTLANIGDITIDGPVATIDGITISNSGTIKVNGALDLGTVALGGTEGHIGTIDADSFNAGQFIVLPNVTQGTNHNMYTVQYLKGITNVPNNGSLTAISHSVSFLADLQKDDTDPDLVRIVMVKIPYKKLLTGTKATEFGKGLDELYTGAANKELEIFDALDMISSKDELGSTFDMELRGNVYANIQQRILDINEVFDTSYENLKGNKLYARESVKIGAIVKSGESKNKNAGVEDYDSKTLGVMVLKEQDHMKYGRSSNVSLGFTQTKFDFDYGSDETVYSLNLGVGFEEFIGESKNVKYLTRGEIGINHHETERKIHLSNGTYKNTGKYWSGTVEWKNKIRYDIPVSSERIDIGVFGTFNLGYGKYQNFKESGDGVELELKSRDMYIVRPGVGTDIALKQYTESGKISLIGKATAEYELGKVYDGANKAKIKNTSAGYYDLEEPKKVKGIIKIGAELKYETREGHSIGFEVTRQEGSVDATRYGINMLYRF